MRSITRVQDRRDDLQLAEKLPAVTDGSWPIAGAAFDEIVATLLTACH